MGHDDGRHDFDFFFGAWQIANRKRVRPLVPGDDEWIEFEAYLRGAADPRRPRERRHLLGARLSGRPGSRASRCGCSSPGPALADLVGVHGRQRAPRHARGRPLPGRRRRPVRVRRHPRRRAVRVRYDWKDIDADSVTWEQSFSFDGGATWDSNWVMGSTRIAAGGRPLCVS